jgi:hypothetical protein
MRTQPNKAAEQEYQNAIVIDATPTATAESMKICWNTGEQKNCSGCYLSNGCKAKE